MDVGLLVVSMHKARDQANEGEGGRERDSENEKREAQR